tara:strand:- start:47 stop:400 length:354 start_codon:yes stop_codon:yes gene_type:complete
LSTVAIVLISIGAVVLLIGAGILILFRKRLFAMLSAGSTAEGKRKEGEEREVSETSFAAYPKKTLPDLMRLSQWSPPSTGITTTRISSSRRKSYRVCKDTEDDAETDAEDETAAPWF